MKMKAKFHNMIQIERIKDIVGDQYSKGNPHFMNGFKHKQVDGMNLLDIQIFNNNSKWEGIVDQIIRDDGSVEIRIKEEFAEDYINNFLVDNIFHGFIPADIIVDREKLVKVKVGKGSMKVAKMVQVVVSGYMYGEFKIANAEQDVKSGDYIFMMKPQQIS